MHRARGDEHVHFVFGQIEPRWHRPECLEALRAKLVEGNPTQGQLHDAATPTAERSARFLKLGKWERAAPACQFFAQIRNVCRNALL
jgi:hypothetical protein